MVTEDFNVESRVGQMITEMSVEERISWLSSREIEEVITEGLK